MEKLGEYLKREREAKNISLEEISKKTRISIKILIALESDDKSKLPGDTFNKGFLRAYAKYVGLDVSDVLRMYDQSYKDIQMPYEEFKREVVEDFYDKKPKNLRALLALLLIVTAIFFIIYSFSSDDEKDIETEVTDTKEVLVEQQENDDNSADEEENNKEEAKEEEQEEEQQQGEQEEQEEQGEQEQPKKQIEKEMADQKALPEKQESMSAKETGTEHKLVLRADGIVWVELQIDDDDPYEFTLNNGEIYKKTASDRFQIKVGNAGKLRIEFDGEDLGKIGEEKEVRKITLPKDQ